MTAPLLFCPTCGNTYRPERKRAPKNAPHPVPASVRPHTLWWVELPCGHGRWVDRGVWERAVALEAKMKEEEDD